MEKRKLTSQLKLSPIYPPRSIDSLPVIESHKIKAKQMMQQGKLEDAKKYLKRVYSKGAIHADICYLIGECEALTGHLQKSKKWLLEALEFEEYCQETLKCIGEVCFKLNELENSERFILAYLKENYKLDRELFSMLAIIYLKKKQYTKSIQAITTKIKIDSQTGVEPVFEDYAKRAVYRVLSGDQNSKDLEDEIKKLIHFAEFEGVKLSSLLKEVRDDEDSRWKNKTLKNGFAKLRDIIKNYNR